MATKKADDVNSWKELKKVPDRLTKIGQPNLQEEQDGFDIWMEEASKQRLEEASKRSEEASKQLEEASKQLEEASNQLEEASKQLEEASKQLEEASKRSEEASKRSEEASKQLEEASKRLEEEQKRLRREQTSLAPENQKNEEQLKNEKPRFVFTKLETSIQKQMLNNIIEYESSWEGRSQCRFLHCVNETCQHCDRMGREDTAPGRQDMRFLAYQDSVVGASEEMTAMKYDPERDNFFDQC